MKAKWISAGIGAVLLAALLFIAPAAALAGWRAAFLALGAAPVGGIVLLLIARLTDADWDAALQPVASTTWLLLPAFMPVVAQQALFVKAPPHLAGWLAWPFFAARGLGTIAFWGWLARRLASGRVSQFGAALALVAHGVLLTIVGTEWLLGTAPGQPQSAAAMVMTTMEVLAATALACLLRSGRERTRRDLSFLMIAAALGLAYLLFMDFLIVWYGNLPTRVGWYVARTAFPWSGLPPLALASGLALPIVCAGLVRTDRAQVAGGLGALVGLLLAAAWIAAPPIATALLATAATMLLAPAVRWRAR